MEMNRTSWLILAIATLFLGLVTLYFKLANPFTPPTPAPTITESGVGEPNTPSGWRVASRGQINVKNRFADAGFYFGKVLIQVWGKATVDSTQAPLSPRGETKGIRADSRFPLPNAPIFCAILERV